MKKRNDNRNKQVRANRIFAFSSAIARMPWRMRVGYILGNNRVVLEINKVNSVVMQSTDYYPFGMPYTDGNYPERQPYKFGGKELDEMHGLNWYDFEARHLNMTIPRFTTMDPLAEKYYNISPYAYCANNPVRFVDPTGKDVAIIGFAAQKIADELNKISKLNITYEPTNQYLSYTKEEGVEYSQFDQALMATMDDKGIMVKLRGVSVEQSYDRTPENGGEPGSIVFGAFEGNKIVGSGDNTKVIATQSIDITTTINAEKAGIDRAGDVVAHELLEGYFGAKDFPGARSTDQKAYKSSHAKSWDILPLKLSTTELLSNGAIRVSINGLAPVIVRPAKK
jgi:RHS repeat-associated protein